MGKVCRQGCSGLWIRKSGGLVVIRRLGPNQTVRRSYRFACLEYNLMPQGDRRERALTVFSYFTTFRRESFRRDERLRGWVLAPAGCERARSLVFGPVCQEDSMEASRTTLGHSRSRGQAEAIRNLPR